MGENGEMIAPGLIGKDLSEEATYEQRLNNEKELHISIFEDNMFQVA